MTTYYCQHSDVSSFLQIPAFTTADRPTISDVEARINEAEDWIDESTDHAWRSKTITNEYHNVDNFYERATGIPIFLSHRQVKALNFSTSGDKLEVWDGSTWTNWLNTPSRVEGRTRDYWLDYEQGILYIINWTRFPVGLRMTYRYGETTVPGDIKKATILLVAKDLIANDDRTSTIPDTGSGVGYLNKIERWEAQIEKILGHRNELILPTK